MINNYEFYETTDFDALFASMYSDLFGELHQAKVLNGIVRTNTWAQGVKEVPVTVLNLRFSDTRINQDLVYGVVATVEFETDHSVHSYFVRRDTIIGVGLILDEKALAIIDEYLAVYQEADKVRIKVANDKAEAEAEIKRRMKEAQDELEKQKKQAEKYEKYKTNVLLKLKELPDNKVRLGIGFYGVLGWLASHMTNLTAALPDFAEPWFKAYFGDAPARVVDQSKKSPSGWISQWGLSFTIHLKKNAKDSIPMLLREYTDRNEAKNVSDTRFIFTLLTDYGFKIGKEQDINEIKRYIPAQYMGEFDEGYAAA